MAIPERYHHRDRFLPREFLLYAGEAGLEVTKVESLLEAGGAPWSIVAWVDSVLAGPETRFQAALALAGQAETLAAMGTVTLIAADPGARTVVGASRAAPRLVEELAALAGQAAAERRQAAAPAAPEPAVLRRQLDRLLARLEASAPVGPRLLLLVADGYPLTAPEAGRFRGPAPGAAPAEEERVALLERAARVLAAYGWIVAALPVRGGDTVTVAPRGDEHEDRRLRHLPAEFEELPPSLFRVRVGPRPPRSPRIVLPLLESALRLDLEPLRALARPTVGAVVVGAEQLAGTLAELGGRRRLWYQAPAEVDGRLRPLRVVMAQDAIEARAPRWVRSGTPEEMAEVLVRRLFSPGAAPPRDLPLRARAASAGGTIMVTLEAAVPPAATLPDGPLRLSLAFDAGEAEVSHRMVDWPPAAGLPGPAVSFAWPPGAARAALLVEDLERGLRTAAVVHRGPPE